MDEGLINRPAAYALKPKYAAIRRLRRYWDLTARVFDLNLVIFSSGEARHRAAQKSQAATWTPDERLPYRSGMPGAGDSIAGDLGCRF